MIIISPDGCLMATALASFIRSVAGAVLGTCIHVCVRVIHAFMDAIVCVYCMYDYHIVAIKPLAPFER